MKNEDFKCEEVYGGFRYRGMHIVIDIDEDPLHPREDCDNLGTLVTWHKRYALGDENRFEPDYWDWLKGVLESTDACDDDIIDRAYENADKIVDLADMQDMMAEMAFEHLVILDVTLYEHGGLLLKMGQPSGFDEGWLGVIYVTMEDARHELAGEGDTRKEIREKAARRLRDELDEYNRYLAMEFYRYEVYEDSSCDTLVGGCGSFDGFDYCLDAAKDNVDSIVG